MAMSNNGLTKVIEECGELVQVAAKMIAYPDREHPDAKGDLRERLQDEIADVMASIDFVTEKLGLDLNAITMRADMKCARFAKWDLTGDDDPPPQGSMQGGVADHVGAPSLHGPFSDER